MNPRRTIVTALVALVLVSAAAAKALTNADVSKLIAAGMSEDVILSAINGAAEKNFDTSADALAALKQAGASDAVLKAVLGISAPTTPVPAAAAGAASEAYEADEMYVMSDGKLESLGYANSEIRVAARALGLGGAGVYAVLHGPAAKATVAKKPTFLLAIPKNAQPDRYVTLANFAVRKNGDRELMIGNQVLVQFRVGVVKDRVVATTITKVSDQSKAAKGVVLYTVTPATELAPGQYAFCAKLTQNGTGMTGNFYDFQVQ